MVGDGSGTTDLRDATLRRALNARCSRTPEPAWMLNGRTVASAATARAAAVDLKSDTAVPLFTVGHSLGEQAFGLLLWNVLGSLIVHAYGGLARRRSGDPLMHSHDVAPACGLSQTRRADAAKVTVPTGAIGECIDVVGDIRERKVTVRVGPLPVALRLHAAEEQLDHSIVPAIARSAHTRLEVIGAAEAPPGITAELHSLIGVNDGPPRPALRRG